MKHRLFSWLYIISVIITISMGNFKPVHAEADDTWWDDDWPYRVPVEVSGTGAVGVNLDFSQYFSELGLVDAVLDLQSIRVIPYLDGNPGDPVPYQETYSNTLMDGESLNLDPAAQDTYWTNNDQVSISLDSDHHVQGSTSIKAEFTISDNLNSEPGIVYNFNDIGLTDWSDYESLTYQVWPEVNASAVDQTPDLFQMELLGLGGCYPKKTGGPAMRMDQWNTVGLALNPYNACTTPDYGELTGIRFFIQVNTLGYAPGTYEPDDRLSLWLDDIRLVDQDGPGEIRWMADPGIDRYYIYFDTLNHTGHSDPEKTTITNVQPGLASAGTAEPGGYFHQITGAETVGLSIWHAPIEEKILKSQTMPVTQKPLLIQAARGEMEAFQVIVQSDSNANLVVNVSDLVNGKYTISADQIDIFRVDYVELTQLSDAFGRLTAWPDPLYPITSGLSVYFPASENQPLWFRVRVPSDAMPGIYSGSLSIGDARVPFTINVWKFSLPSSTTLPLEIGFDWDTVLEAYGGTVNGIPQLCYDTLTSAVTSTLADYHLIPLPEGQEKPDGMVVSLTDYEVTVAHNAQTQSGEHVWWAFDAYDAPPLPNPAILDRTGMEARILPWMAWLDRVDGLFYSQAVDWDPDPWTHPYSNDLANGDGFLFYPPKDETLGFNPCDPTSNRMIPSIRLELLREGLEDYAYLKLITGHDPEIGEVNESDAWAETLIGSRTAFLHSPAALAKTRADLADLLQSKQSAIYFPLLIH